MDLASDCVVRPRVIAPDHTASLVGQLVRRCQRRLAAATVPQIAPSHFLFSSSRAPFGSSSKPSSLPYSPNTCRRLRQTFQPALLWRPILPYFVCKAGLTEKEFISGMHTTNTHFIHKYRAAVIALEVFAALREDAKHSRVGRESLQIYSKRMSPAPKHVTCSYTRLNDIPTLALIAPPHSSSVKPHKHSAVPVLAI